MLRRVIIVNFFLIIILSGTVFNSSAQTIEKDTAWNAIKTIKNDSTRFEKTLEYLSRLIVKKSPMAIDLKNRLLTLATKKGDSIAVGRIYSSVGFSYLTLGEFDKAFKNYFAALPNVERYGIPSQKIRIYQDLMWIQFQLKDFQKAQNYLERALELSKAQKVPAKEAEIYNMFGILHDSQLKHGQAVNYYNKALLLNQKTGSKFNQVSTLINLAISQRRLKHYDEALKNLLNAKTISDSLKNDYYKQALAQNIGEVAYDAKDFTLAEKHILEAYKLSGKNSEPVLKKGLFTLLKNIYKQKGNFEKALLYADSLAVINDAIYEKDRLGHARQTEALYESKLKDERIFHQNLVADRQRQSLEFQKRQLQLSNSERELQQLELIKKQELLEADKFKQESDREKQRLLFLLNTQDKNKEIARQNKLIVEANDFKIYSILMIILVSSFGALSYYSYRKSKSLNAIISSQKDEIEHSSNVKDKIFGVVSHDLKAPIHTLMAFTQILDYEDVPQETMKLYIGELKKSLAHTGMMMENLLNWAASQMQGFKPVPKLFDINLIAAEVITSMGIETSFKSIVVKNNIPSGTLVYADINMTQVVLRNLINNAVKYTHINGVIELNHESKNPGEIAVSVEDNGVGMTQAAIDRFNRTDFLEFSESTRGTMKEKGTGLGLVLCKNLTTLMSGRIFATTCEKQPGTKFSLILPDAESSR